MKRMKQAIKIGGKAIRSQDAFGKPVTVNYKGADTYRSCCGGLTTIAIIVVVCWQLWFSGKSMYDRENPNQASYSKLTNRGPEESLNVTELGGQVYIALVNRTETLGGDQKDEIIDWDSEYLTGKFDVSKNGERQNITNLPLCEDGDEFFEKAKFTSGLDITDFPKLRCIPADQFSLYNQPSET